MIPDPHRVATAGMRPGQQPFPWTPFLRAGKGGMQWWVSQGCSARGPLGPCQPPPTPSQAWWQGRTSRGPTRPISLQAAPGTHEAEGLAAQGRVWPFPASSGLSWLFVLPQKLPTQAQDSSKEGRG